MMSKLRHTNKGYYFLFSEANVQCMINMLCIRENQIIVLLLHELIKHIFPEMLTQVFQRDHSPLHTSIYMYVYMYI